MTKGVQLQRISLANMDRVKKIGIYGETFNDVITRLLDCWDRAKRERDD